MAKYAAIDMGSNAIRLAIGVVAENGKLTVIESQRAPIRLGEDSFSNGVISQRIQDLTIGALRGFQKSISQHSARKMRAVATSAVREAANAKEFCEHVTEATGIHLDVIDGEEEGMLIRSAIEEVLDVNGGTFWGIDIGGGSVEVTFSMDGSLRLAESLKIGGVRMLKLVKPDGSIGEGFRSRVVEELEKLDQRTRQLPARDGVVLSVGTGGNIETLGDLRVSLLGRKRNGFISRDEIEEIEMNLASLSVQERVERLNLRPDRADVILPASFVLRSLMEYIGSHELKIPRVGLKEGVLMELAARG